MPSRITCTASGVDRSRSVSSTRRMNFPAERRAYSQLKSAVRTPPICNRPVGLGANRVITFMELGVDMARMVAAIHGRIQHSSVRLRRRLPVEEPAFVRREDPRQEDPPDRRRATELHEGCAAVSRTGARGLVLAGHRAYRTALRREHVG